MNSHTSIFDQFTNQYSLSKTLRFELRPVGRTQQMLEENKVFEIDERRKKAYENIKPYFDTLHRDFINESLTHTRLEGLSEYFEIFKQFRTDKKNKPLQKKIDAQRKALREQVVSFFDARGKQWATEKYSHLKIKKKDLNILFEEQVFQILKDRYGNEERTQLVDEETGEIVSIFDGWKGFTGYFTKFYKTRENFYKSDGTSTALATRIINQNLDRFLDNLLTYNSIKDKIDVAEVEEFFQIKADEVFSIHFYNQCVLQEGIDTYNDFLGGKTLENGEKKRGINEIINKHRQDNKGEKLPFLKKLDKQILSEKDKFIDEIETDEELLGVLRRFHENAQEKTQLLRSLISKFVTNNQQFDLRGIYFDKKVFDPYSSRWVATELAEELHEKIIKQKKKDGYTNKDFIPLLYIKNALEDFPKEIRLWRDRYYKTPDSDSDGGIISEGEPSWEQFLKIFEFEFFSHFEQTDLNSETGEKYKTGYDIFAPQLKDLVDDFEIDKNSRVIIKNFADEVLRIYQMAKYFALEKKRAWDENLNLDPDFYTHIDYGFKDKFHENAYEEIVQPYNKIRNYLTKKPYSEDKWKLNFGKGKLLDGWPDSPEGTTQYCGFIFRKSNKYFLGVTDFPRILDEERFPKAYNPAKDDQYEKMVYKQIDAKTLYGSAYIGTYGSKYSDDQTKLTDAELIKRMEVVLEQKSKPFPELRKILDRVKEGKFNEAKALAREISEGSFYSTSFVPVSASYIQKGIHEVARNKKGDLDKKKLYLFQIYNKDFSEKSTGTKNLHTLYFEELFSQANIDNNFPFKLNGQAEIFYRPKTDAKKLGTKKDKSGKEVINRKRYLENKVFFHVPITLHRTSETPSKGFGKKYNAQVNNFLANNPDINIIGVDRGEKHLAYYSVINQQGEILEGGSLNAVNQVDYHEKLAKRAEEREQARKDWQDVEGIKDLKKGYISQVVRKLADLAIKHNAIIVMEDLNMRFKQIRGGIEKSAYQQLEKALIEKLNFLVNKGAVDPTKAGHLLKAYQLTAPFETFKDMGKQTGIIFYTQASYTSKIDPLTGWRPNIYSKYFNADQAKKDILKFNDVSFNKEQDRFEFTYDVRKFSNAKEFPNKTTWTICSNIERFRWDRKLNSNKGGYTHYASLTENFKELFEQYEIDYTNNIIQQIQLIEIKGNEKFFKDLIFYLGLICQIRNTQQDKDGNENDFILSPVEPFFDSRKADDFTKDLPQNGDDNGAYNIARKGIIVLNKISDFYNENGTTNKLSWNDLYVSHIDWDNFATKK